MIDKRKRRSAIWLLPDKEFRDLVKQSESYVEILRHFGKENKGGNQRTLMRRIHEDGISTHHIDSTRRERLFNNHKKALPLETVMVKNSTYSRGSLKIRLLRDQIIDNKCSICGQEPNWNGKPLILVLDHINGEGQDHRSQNLRLLCPNCNSQQPTFAGRSNKKHLNCSKCGRSVTKHSTGLCIRCTNHKNRKVKNRPTKESLLDDLKSMGYCAIGRKYGVSDNAIRKWLRSA